MNLYNIHVAKSSAVMILICLMLLEVRHPYLKVCKAEKAF